MPDIPSVSNRPADLKRSLAKKLLGQLSQEAKKESEGAFNPTRIKLLQQFKLATPLVRGDGHYLYDSNGTQYLDFLSQYGAVAFGHNPAELWRVLYTSGEEKMASMVQPYVPFAAVELANRLAEITPGDLEFSIFTNSGAEAVEAAIKLARARSGRLTILSTKNSFHGKTLGALSATGKPGYQTPFGAPVPHFDYVPFGVLEALEERLGDAADEIAAFIVEPIQGEGGVIPAPSGYLGSALALCRQYGVLSIVDEIQTGLGRTGSLFCLPDDADGPDIMVLGKALGGGLMPIGACIATADTWDNEFGMLHSSTFANNNLACRVALAAIDLLLSNDQHLVQHVAVTGDYLMQRLQQLQARYPKVIKQVRGRGFMTGVEFYPYTGNDSYVMAYCSMNEYLIAFFSAYLFDVHHIVTAPMFNNSSVLRLQPPFTVGREEIERMTEALDDLCDVLQRKDYYQLIRHFIGSSEVGTEKHSYTDTYQTRLEISEPDYIQPKNAFAFIVHYTSEQNLISCDPSLEQFSAKELEQWKDWSKSMGPGLIHHQPEIRSDIGHRAQGWLIAIPLLPRDMLSMGRATSLSLLEDALKLAKKQGAKVLGLGGFTSIVSRGGKDLTHHGIAITSGNSLTTLMAADGIENVMQRLHQDIKDADISIVGATGAIGRLAALLLASRVKSLTLVGNAASPNALSRCYAIAGEIYHMLIDQAEINKPMTDNTSRNIGDKVVGPLLNTSIEQLPEPQLELARKLRMQIRSGDVAGYEKLAMTMEQVMQQAGMKPPIHCSVEIDAVLVEADVIVVATNSETSLIESQHLKPGAVVCDIARPLNVSPDVIAQRKDVLVFEGGLVELPQPVYFGQMQGLPEGIILGCLAETVLLALEGDHRNHSIGNRLELQEAAYLKKLAEKHGFNCAPAHCHGKLLNDNDFDRIISLSIPSAENSDDRMVA